MRLDELAPPKELKPGAVGKVGNITYKYDANKGWVMPSGVPAAGMAKNQLMLQYGRDPSGDPIQPGMLQKLGKKLGLDKMAPFGQGIDPKAGMLAKGMGTLGSMLGRAASKIIAPKGRPTAQDADGDGQPDAPATQAAPKPTQVNNPAVQNLNNYVKGVAAELNKPGANKIALTKELVNFMADRKGTPEWENASNSMKVILKRAGLNPNFANTALQRIQAGQTMESLQMLFINSLLEELNLTFDDLELSESVVEVEGIKHYIVEDNSIAQLRKLAGI
jgi:hypothetical protein